MNTGVARPRLNWSLARNVFVPPISYSICECILARGSRVAPGPPSQNRRIHDGQWKSRSVPSLAIDNNESGESYEILTLVFYCETHPSV